jgi:hypothetical protein
MDDKGIPSLKNQINDYREYMDMNYIILMKKKEQKTIKAPILKDQMKQLRPKKEPKEVTPPTFQVLWVGFTFYHWGFRPKAPNVWNGSSHVLCNGKISTTFTSSDYLTFKT